MQLLVITLAFIFVQYHIDLKECEAHLHRCKSAKSRKKKKWIKWSDINVQIIDMQFRHMFRMTREYFQQLCQTMIRNFGESCFKSEEYIDSFLDIDSSSSFYSWKSRLHNVHVKTSGGYISGEVKLVISIWILAGGDPFDICDIFYIYPSWCTEIFINVMKKIDCRY